MLSWGKITLLLCFFGFLKEFRPLEPYITRYFVSSGKNLTREEVNQEIYPIGTYAHLALLVIIFLTTDFLRCKPVLFIQGLAGICTYAIVISGTSKFVLQIGQVFYALFVAADVAYYTYMYAVSDQQQYQLVSSYTRIGILLGRFTSGVLAQAIVSSGLQDLQALVYLTLAGISLATIVSLCLPMPPRSVYFHRERVDEGSAEDRFIDAAVGLNATATANGNASNAGSAKSRHVASLVALRRDFVAMYSNLDVLRWSVWWALATCGYMQVSAYIQILWEETLDERNMNETLYSGAVDAIYTLFGTAALWLVGRQRINLRAHSSLILTLCSVVDGALILVCATSKNIWIQYTFYIFFKVVYHSMMVLASSEVAKGASSDRRALTFGFNTFLALLLQSGLTLAVASSSGLALTIRTQFLVYGSYFVVMGALFASCAILGIVFKRGQSHLQKCNDVENAL